jgi:hypothetical protein
MKPVEAFGVVVRTIGLLILLSALWSLLLGVLAVVSGGGPGIVFVGAGVLLMFASLGILSEADRIASWTYPSGNKHS